MGFFFVIFFCAPFTLIAPPPGILKWFIRFFGFFIFKSCFGGFCLSVCLINEWGWFISLYHCLFIHVTLYTCIFLYLFSPSHYHCEVNTYMDMIVKCLTRMLHCVKCLTRMLYWFNPFTASCPESQSFPAPAVQNQNHFFAHLLPKSDKAKLFTIQTIWKTTGNTLHYIPLQLFRLFITGESLECVLSHVSSVAVLRLWRWALLLHWCDNGSERVNLLSNESVGVSVRAVAYLLDEMRWSVCTHSVFHSHHVYELLRPCSAKGKWWTYFQTKSKSKTLQVHISMANMLCALALQFGFHCSIFIMKQPQLRWSGTLSAS